MHRQKDTKERLLHRLKISRGHLDKVIQMVEADEYCINTIHQSQAVQSALREFDNLTLENHLNTCVVDHIKKGHSKRAIDEIISVVRKNT